MEHNLYITITPGGELKMGTCEHCVAQEQGRPARAWEPDGDNDLDFDRDTLIARLAQLGVTVSISQQYVCP